MWISLLLTLVFLLLIIGVIYLLYSKIKDFFNQIGNAIGDAGKEVGDAGKKALDVGQKLFAGGKFNNDVSTGLNKLPGVSSVLDKVDLNNTASAIPRNVQGLSAKLGGEALQGDNINDLVKTATQLANESTEKKEILAKARSGANALSSNAKTLPL